MGSMMRTILPFASCLLLFGCAASTAAPETAAHQTDARPSAGKKVTGRLPPEVIQRIVREHFPDYRHCYNDGLQRDPMLQGKVVVRFVIKRDGSISGVEMGGPQSSLQAMAKHFESYSSRGTMRITCMSYRARINKQETLPRVVIEQSETSCARRRNENPRFGDLVGGSVFLTIGLNGSATRPTGA
jgi:hypothetical protein